MLNLGEYLFIAVPSGIVSSNLFLFSRDMIVSNLRKLSSVMKVRNFFCLCFNANLCLICFPTFAIFCMSCSWRSLFVTNFGKIYWFWVGFWPLTVLKTRLKSVSVIATSSLIPILSKCSEIVLSEFYSTSINLFFGISRLYCNYICLR
jgi:hypothetical protein